MSHSLILVCDVYDQGGRLPMPLPYSSSGSWAPVCYSGGVHVIDFSEAVEHDYCLGPGCYELPKAREYLELPPN
jgi:hypothetical protein